MGRYYIMEIIAYFDEWNSAYRIILNIPWKTTITGSDTEPWPYKSSATAYTVATAKEAFPEFFSENYTYFAKDSTAYDNLRTLGFTNVIDPSYRGRKIVIDENGTYFYYDTTNRLHLGQGDTEWGNYGVSSSYQAVSAIGYIYESNDRAHIEFVGINSFATAPLRFRMTIDYSAPTAQVEQILNFWSASSSPATDPYEQGGTSGTGGGQGTFDLSSDAVDFPALPTLTAVSTGLVSVYTPTLTQLNALANYMWNANPTDVDWWKKLVANPLDLILGLSIVPVAVPAGATNNVKVGLIDTGVSMTRAASQFVEVDCGSLEIKEFWGSALDYSPFRKHSIYLPFIGTRTISTDDIMGKTVHVKYHIDLLSGALTALVKCGDAVLYQYSGACAVSLPLTGETFTNVITSTIQLAAGLAGTVASGGAAAGVTLANAANSVMSMKPVIERAGGVSGAAGQLGVMTPYIIGEIPRQSVPENYNTFAGYPSNIKATLGDLSGFTSIETIQLQNIPATAAEYAEIEQLLKDGVIL